jgi:hypothetical protein
MQSPVQVPGLLGAAEIVGTVVDGLMSAIAINTPILTNPDR